MSDPAPIAAPGEPSDEEILQRLREMQQAGQVPGRAPRTPDQPIPVPTTSEPGLDMPSTPYSDVELKRRMAEMPHAPSFGETVLDMLKSGGSKAVEGLVKLPGIGGEAEGLTRNAVSLGSQLFGGEGTDPVTMKKSRVLPNTTDMSKVWDLLTGIKFYDPKYAPGKVVGAGAEMAAGGGALSGAKTLGQMGRNAIRYGAVPGAVGEAGGQVVEGLGMDKAAADVTRFLGTILGGSAAGLAKTRDLAPKYEALDAAMQRSFATAKQEGVVIAPSALARVLHDAQVAAQKAHMPTAPGTEGAAPASEKMLATLRDASNRALTLQEVHEVRQKLNSLIGSMNKVNGEYTNETDARIAMAIKNAYDNWYPSLTQKDLAAGNVVVNGKVPNVARATRALKDGIALSARLHRADEVASLVDYATGAVNPKTGFNFADALRARVRKLSRDKSWMKQWSPDEQSAIYSIIGRTRGMKGAGRVKPVNWALQKLGGFSPTHIVGGIKSGGLGAAFAGGGYAATGGDLGKAAMIAGVPAGVGFIGRQGANLLARRDLGKLEQIVRGGAGSVPDNPLLYGAPLAAWWGSQAGNADEGADPLSKPLGLGE